MLLQVNQTIAFQSGIQAFTCPEGFAPSLAPIVQKYLKASPYVMVHVSKHFTGIPIIEVVTPSAKDAVYFSDYMDKSSFVSTAGLHPEFFPECRCGFFAGHDVEIVKISASQITIKAEGKTKKIQDLFLVHSDNSGFVTVYAESKFTFDFLFQPSGDTLAHESGHYNKVVGIPHHTRSGEVVGAVGFFVKGPVEPMKVDICKEGRNNPALRSSLFGTADTAVTFNHRALKPEPDQLKNTPVGYAPLEFYHQLLMGDAVKVARKISVIHFYPAELEVTANLIKGTMGTPLRTKTMGAIEKVCLKDRFENEKYGGLNNSVPHTGYAQRAQFAIGFGDVDAFHRGGFIAFGYQAFLNFIKIAGYAAGTRLNAFNADPIDSRCSLVRLYSRPRRFKYVTAMSSVVKGIKPKLRFSFGLAAQFPPQKGNFYRQPGFRFESVCHPFRYGASIAQAGLLSFRVNMTEVRLLGSTGITPLPRYYEPLRIPTVNDERVIDSPPTLSLRRNPFALGITSDLPGSSADLSTRALPNHPEQSHRFFRSFIAGEWQASPIPEGWPLSIKCNEAETGSLTLGSRLRRQGVQSLRPSYLQRRTGLTPHVWLPSRDRPRLHIERAIYMSDTFQSDRSARLGLAYRRHRENQDKDHEALGINQKDFI